MVFARLTETSRMWRPIIPLLAEVYRGAPDLPGIGDASIPAGKLDMITAAKQIHSSRALS